MAVMERIQAEVEGHPIVLFMKGTPEYPMCGYSARAVQALLLCRGYNLDVDGEYGPATAAAVGRFQTASGLDTDSECGPRTWAALLTLPGGDAA